jgi:hypothetical protein
MGLLVGDLKRTIVMTKPMRDKAEVAVEYPDNFTSARSLTLHGSTLTSIRPALP